MFKIAKVYVQICTILMLVLVVQIVVTPNAIAACPLAGAPQNPTTMTAGGSGNVLCDLSLSAGDVIEFTMTALGGTFYYEADLYKDGTSIDLKDHSSSVTDRFEIKEAGTYHLAWREFFAPNTSATISARIIKGGAGGAAEDISQATAPLIVQNGLALTSKIMNGHMQSLNRGANVGDTNLVGLKTTGKPAGSVLTNYRLWGDLAFSRIGGTDENDGFNGLLSSFVAGLDYHLSSQLTIGSAVTLDTGRLDKKQQGVSDLESSQTTFGLSPYIHYQIDDMFSLSSFGNLAYSKIRSAQGTTAVDQRAFRAFLEANAAASHQWGHFGLLGEMGLNYAVTRYFDAETSQNTEIAGRADSQASLRLLIQPSYRFQLGAQDQLEAYSLAEYRYRFVMTERPLSLTNTIPMTDHHDLRAGLGFRYLGGDDLAVGLEASHLFLQRDYSETQLKGHISLSF